MVTLLSVIHICTLYLYFLFLFLRMYNYILYTTCTMNIYCSQIVGDIWTLRIVALTKAMTHT